MLATLTDEQRAIRDTAERFAREKLAPHYAERDGVDRLDRTVIREMGSLGLIAPDLPADLGGSGADGVTAGIVMEAIAYGDMNAAYVPLLNSLVGGIIARYAGEHIAREWIPRAASGEALLALSLTEPRGGSDAANLQLSAEKTGNGYVLNGEKTGTSLADQADAIVVFARTGAKDAGARGVSAFFVPASEPGISFTRFDDAGSKTVGRGSVFFDNVKLPADSLMSEENAGFAQVMQGFDYSRALIGLQCVAVAQASLDETWAYIQEREAFGRPLAQFQGVTFPLAEAETAITAARQLCYLTLALRDAGEPHTKEAAMAKFAGPKSAFEAIHQCLLTFGHYGWTKDLPHEQRLRDVMGLEIGDGTAQIMKLIIAREKVGRIAVQYA